MAALTASMRRVAPQQAAVAGLSDVHADREMAAKELCSPAEAKAVRATARRRLPQIEFKQSTLETGSSKKSF